MFSLLVQWLSVNLDRPKCLCLCSVPLPAVVMSFSPGPSGPLGGTNIQEQRDRWERKRSRTARELVQTEQRYCQQLELVTTVRTVPVSITMKASRLNLEIDTKSPPRCHPLTCSSVNITLI